MIGSYGFIDIDHLDDSPIKLLDFGIEQRHNELYAFDNRNRDSYEGFIFQFTLEGEGSIDIENSTYTLPKNKGFLIDIPSTTKYYLPNNKGAYWKFFYIHFTGSLIQTYFNKIMNLSGNIVQLDSDAMALKHFFAEYNAISNGKVYEQYEGSEFIYRFLTSLLRDIERVPSTPHVEKALQWMHRHYAQQKSLSEMCRELDVTLPHLSRQFHMQKGIAPIQYLTNIRLHNAMTLLLNTDQTLDAIAYQCGFSNGNYFSKVFKKYLKTTPTAYRLNNG